MIINSEKYLKELFNLLSIPSISAQSGHKKDMEKACLWLQKKFISLGFKSEILPTKGHPVVYSELITDHKSPTTVLLYGHYDVQDPGNLDEWTSEPFKPEVRSGNIYARGANDNKGQHMTWISALEEIGKSKNKLPINIKFILEGEEEIGSKNLEEFCNENKSLLKSDICIVSDTDSISEDQPVITYGLRGIIYLEINIKTLPKDVHSGTYGGNISNPLNILTNLLSSLKDEGNKILIPNFYDNIRKVSTKELKQINNYPFGSNEIKRETGAKQVVGEKGFTVQERSGIRPSLDINGIWGGYQGEGAKTIIPSEAWAKVSMRIVPYQDPNKIIEATEKYLKKQLPKGAEIKIMTLAADSAVLMDTNSKYFRLAEKAYKKVFGKVPFYHLHGATVPVGGIVKRVLGIDTIYMGYGLPDDGLHGPNEKFSLSMFEKGIRTNIDFLKSI